MTMTNQNLSGLFNPQIRLWENTEAGVLELTVPKSEIKSVSSVQGTPHSSSYKRLSRDSQVK